MILQELWVVLNESNEVFSGFDLKGNPKFEKGFERAFAAMYSYCDYRPWGKPEAEALITNESLYDCCHIAKIKISL